MVGFIILIVGWVLSIKAILEIWKWNVDTVKKLLVIILLLILNVIGLAVYYFWGRENLPQMLK